MDNGRMTTPANYQNRSLTMNLNDFSNSKFLSKSDVPEQGQVLTIAGFGIEEMRDKTRKPYVTWVEQVKPLLLNKTNRSRLEVICGTSQTEAMVGRKVVVFNDPLVEMSGQVVGGLRIRPVANPVPAATLTASERELQEALALVRSRAEAAQAPALKADPNDDIPF
jgi:hypothetical protein